MTGEGREEGIGKGRRDREGKRMKGRGYDFFYSLAPPH